MQMRKHKPGTEQGKLKFFGDEGITIPHPEGDEWLGALSKFSGELMDTVADRGWGIRFNGKCRDLFSHYVENKKMSKKDAIAQIQKDVETVRHDSEKFYKWMAEQSERGPGRTRVVNITVPKGTSVDQAFVDALTEQNPGIKLNLIYQE